MPDFDEAYVHDRIAQILEIIRPGTVMTKYVVVIEFLNTTGNPDMLASASSTTSWDVMGLLEYVMETERWHVRRMLDESHGGD